MKITAELRLQFLKEFGYQPEEMPVFKELIEENHELKEVLHGIISCIGNTLTSYAEAQDYIYKVAKEAVGDE